MENKKHYCTVENDGVAVCVCKHRPCGQLKHKEQECEELHKRTASIIHCLTGGRLSYSTYTLEGCKDAYIDQLRIDVERATKELEEENGELKAENFAFEGLVKTQDNLIDDLQNKNEKYKQALDEIEKILNTRNEQGRGFCDTRLPLILDIVNKTKEQ